MNVLIIGAAGKTGQEVTRRALAAGHSVTALVHDGETYTPPSSAVRVVAGDATTAGVMDVAMAGQDAVIDTVGGRTPYLNTDLERNVAKSALAAMQQQGVRRIIIVSMAGVGDSVHQIGFFYEHLLLPTFLRGARKDKLAMEQAVEAAGVDFVLVRPPVLRDAEATGNVQIVMEDEQAATITRGDLAQFLINQLQSDQYLGQAVVIQNG